MLTSKMATNKLKPVLKSNKFVHKISIIIKLVLNSINVSLLNVYFNKIN